MDCVFVVSGKVTVSRVALGNPRASCVNKGGARAVLADHMLWNGTQW